MLLLDCSVKGGPQFLQLLIAVSDLLPLLPDYHHQLLQGHLPSLYLFLGKGLVIAEAVELSQDMLAEGLGLLEVCLLHLEQLLLGAVTRHVVPNAVGSSGWPWST